MPFRNNYTLEGVLTSCSIHWQARTFDVLSYNAAMFIFAYTVPLAVIVYCNMKIFLTVNRTATLDVSEHHRVRDEL